ncbi:hypothetical protein Nepgr_018373 [Nepenthes gracilis]|uniref:Uncharacterized protein n=1 Tax=Nepenthes gracilis TaxID=150966 RepID=A0AAD3STY3_NEPGR|nr:hypothetical protein Nepgr_018373 [Nepenthes gracilis]
MFISCSPKIIPVTFSGYVQLAFLCCSSKFLSCAASPDRPSYSTGQRGSYGGTSLERSGSFRESMENPILSSLPSMSRSSAAVTHDDVTSFFQCLRLDPKSVAADYKLHRQGGFKRILGVALGISQDDSPSSLKGKLLSSASPENLKKARADVRLSSDKAREKVKIFSEAISVLNKFFPSVPSRKRSRTDIISAYRAGAISSSDRSGLGPNICKMGNSTLPMGNAVEMEQQRPEKRIKGAVISKRTRTSLLDARASSLPRPSMMVEKDRDMLRLANSGAVLGDGSLSIGVDGWEKLKMKKKRSGIKPDATSSTLSSKPVDGYRNPKPGMQQRPVTDSLSRLNDSHGFRPGVGNGALGVGKPEGSLQQTGSGVRSSISRGEQENNSVLCDKKECSIASDKERINLKAVNKISVREEYSSASPTANTKVPASVRAPRTSAGAFPKLSPMVPRQSASSDWEIAQNTNRSTSVAGANSRKRTSAARSSSLPVSHRAGQRPQKMSRIARQTNVLPIVSSNDEDPAFDFISDVIDNNNGQTVARCFPSSSQQVKLKNDHIASAALSESEESGVADIKSKDKKRMFDEVDDKAGAAGQNVPKGSYRVPPSRKNKLITGEDIGDGVRRQGRTGRGLTSTRSLAAPSFEKLGNVEMVKQLGTSKMGFYKAESKAGRPPSRKLSDRKAFVRHRHSAVPAAVDFPGLDDGQAGLLAAARAVFNRSNESSFWRFMEPLFGFICEEDIVFLKQQGELISTLLPANLVSTDADNSGIFPNGFQLIEHERNAGFSSVLGTQTVEHLQEQLTLDTRSYNAIPLCQRLIAALITEEHDEDHRNGINEDILVDDCRAVFQLDAELESGNYALMGNMDTVGSATLDPAIKRSLDELEGREEPEPGSQMAVIQNGHPMNGLHPGSEMLPNVISPECQYNNMPLDQRLLMEIQSIGIFPEQPEVSVTENHEISREIRNLERTYHEQVSRKRGFVDKLLKSASKTRELQEKDYEQCALDELVIMAYGKYMGWDNPSGGKSTSSKVTRQASLAFVRRTLEHCHKYEATGFSCFSEPSFKDILRSGPTQLIEAKTAENHKQNVVNNTLYSAGVTLPSNHLSEHTFGKVDAWSNKVKKREVLLDDVGSNAVVTSVGPPDTEGSLSTNAKGKRSERGKEGKGLGREVLSRNGTSRSGRPVVGNAKGERKSKAKPKQKTTQLSASVNGLLGKVSEQPNAPFSSVLKSSEDTTNNCNVEKDDFCLELDDPDLQIPGMDVDLSGQGQDLGSWLNINDDGLQDHDFMGLEIPMDDLADVNMMV